MPAISRLLCATILHLISCCTASAANAQDYRPVECAASRPYTGPSAPRFDMGLLDIPSGDIEGALTPALVERLEQAVEKAITLSGSKHIGGAIAIPGQGHWQSRAEPDRPLYHWASAGKTFTAVAILQLVEEGRISLDQTVSNWVDGVPNGQAITIQHLLAHTSGLFSANEDRRFRRDPRPLSLVEELAILRRHGAMFCPGEKWRYSNSGYTLLGVILEKVENRPYAEVIRARVINRLSLKSTRVVTPDDGLTDTVPAVVIPGEMAADPRRAGAAGGIVASPADIIRFWHGLLEGALLQPQTLRAAFTDLYPMFDNPASYGLGVMVYQLPGGELWIGHSGGGPGLKAIVAYAPARRAFVSVALSGTKGAEPTALLLLQQLAQP